MNTLWTFGDSFTFGHGCRPDGPDDGYYPKYKKEGDNIWPNHLGKMLNLEVKNFGECGASNDYIIDSIIDNWNFIKEGDFAIIQIGWHARFDMPYDGTLQTPFFDFNYPDYFSLYTKEEKETIINFQYLFTNNKLYKKRHLKRFDFLNKLLKEKNIKTFTWDVDYIQYTTRFEKIAIATNGEIDDWHFSFKGHKDFANMVYKKVVNPQLI